MREEEKAGYSYSRAKRVCKSKQLKGSFGSFYAQEKLLREKSLCKEYIHKLFPFNGVAVRLRTSIYYTRKIDGATASQVQVV